MPLYCTTGIFCTNIKMMTTMKIIKKSLSTPRQLSSPITIPIHDQQPSTSRGNQEEIEFCNIYDLYDEHNSSDSD